MDWRDGVWLWVSWGGMKATGSLWAKRGFIGLVFVGLLVGPDAFRSRIGCRDGELLVSQRGQVACVSSEMGAGVTDDFLPAVR